MVPNDNDKFIKGINPWTGKMHDVRYDLDESLPKDVSDILSVYSFYTACADVAMSEMSNSSDDIFIDDEDSVYTQLSYPTVEIKTIAYFGSDYVLKSLKDHKDLYPTHTYSGLINIATKLNIKKDKGRAVIDIIYEDKSNSTPFPKIEPIN